jgi:hypothetical protein
MSSLQADAGVAADAAARGGGVEVGLAAVGAVAVAVPAARGAHRELARARGAGGRRPREGARVAAAPAVRAVGGEGDLAAVARVHVAVGEARGAGPHHAGPGRAGGRGVGEGAAPPARAAVGGAGGERHLAAVGRAHVAVGEARPARVERARARRAGGRRVGEGAGASPQHPAGGGRGLEVGLAAVGGAHVAVGEARRQAPSAQAPSRHAAAALAKEHERRRRRSGRWWWWRSRSRWRGSCRSRRSRRCRRPSRRRPSRRWRRRWRRSTVVPHAPQLAVSPRTVTSQPLATRRRSRRSPPRSSRSSPPGA